MASRDECERCFEAYVVIFTYIFKCSGLRHCMTAYRCCFEVLLEKAIQSRRFS